MSNKRFSFEQAAKGGRSVVLLGTLTLVISSGAYAVANTMAENRVAGGSPAALRLTTRVVNQSYCYHGTEMYSVDLTLKLRYANQSAETLILRKDVNEKAEILVAATPADLERGAVEYRAMPQVPPPVKDALRYGNTPDDRFVILKPGEAYETDDAVEIPVTRQGLHPFRDSVSPGKHVLTAKYFTWTEGHSLADQLRSRWGQYGRLISDVTTSEPSWFEVAANLETETCTK